MNASEYKDRCRFGAEEVDLCVVGHDNVFCEFNWLLRFVMLLLARLHIM